MATYPKCARPISLGELGALCCLAVFDAPRAGSCCRSGEVSHHALLLGYPTGIGSLGHDRNEGFRRASMGAVASHGLAVGRDAGGALQHPVIEVGASVAQD